MVDITTRVLGATAKGSPLTNEEIDTNFINLNTEVVSKLSGNQTITLSGDASGTGATAIAVTLANSGVTAGAYTKVTVDAKGRVTAGASLASADLPTYAGTLTSSQITTGLGFTPYNSTNPNGYTSNTGTVTSVSGTGTVSGLTLSGTVTGSGPLTLGGTLSLTSANVTTALGYTPYNSTNPNGYTSNTGTVTSVSGTGSVNGLTLSGTVTSSGSLTLGGTLSGISLTTQVSGTLPVASGGTGATSLTSGYLVKGNGTSAVSASVVYDNGTNVGIGVITPSVKLDVNGTIWAHASSAAIGMDVIGRSADNAGQIRFLNSAASTILGTLASYGNDLALLNNTESFSLLFGTNGTERMRIDSSGNVGIGTDAPAGKLDINGSTVNNTVAVAASAIDCSAGNYFTKTTTGSLTWTVTNVPASRAYSFILELTNGGKGAQTWFSGIKWPGGTAPTLTASGVDLLGFITDDGGTTWRGVQLMKDSK